MTTPARGRTRPRPAWLVTGAVIWLFLASSIVLEQGADTAAQWGSVAGIGLAAVLVLIAPVRGLARVLARPVRRGIRAITRRSGNEVP